MFGKGKHYINKKTLMLMKSYYKPRKYDKWWLMCDNNFIPLYLFIPLFVFIHPYNIFMQNKYLFKICYYLK